MAKALQRPRIYTAQALDSGARLRLEADASRHLSLVLRHRVGDALTLFNGRGGEYSAHVLSADAKGAAVEVALDAFSDVSREPPCHVHVACPVLRGARMDFLLQKAVELGAGELSLLHCERGMARPGDGLGPRLSRWRRQIVHACEQSGRTALPALHTPVPLAQWLADVVAERRLLLCPLGAPHTQPLPPQRVALLSGPEGGWSDAEREAALAAGFAAWRLGRRVLRAETAPLAGLAALEQLSAAG